MARRPRRLNRDPPFIMSDPKSLKPGLTVYTLYNPVISEPDPDNDSGYQKRVKESKHKYSEFVSYF